MHTLSKNLSTLHGTGLILNVVLGGGLLALPGLVIQQVGNQALWAWALCALTALPLIAVSTIMGRNFPNAGGVAHFAGLAFGRTTQIITSMLFLGAAVFGLPSIALTGGYYLAEITALHPVLSACGIVFFAALVNLISPKVVSNISSVIALAIFLSLVALICLGLSVVNWSEVPQNIPIGNALDWSKIATPYMMIFFAFTGWEATSSLSEEFKNPKRDFPRAMWLSFFIACTMYLAMAFTMQNVAITSSHEASFVSLATIAFGHWGEMVIASLAVVIIFANIMGAIWVVSRLLFSLSREGYLPIRIATNANGLPISAIILTASVLIGVLVLNLLGLLRIEQMLAIAGQNFFIIFLLIASALFRLPPNPTARLLAVVSLVIVSMIIVISGESLYYPIGLMGLGVIFAYLTKKFPVQDRE